MPLEYQSSCFEAIIVFRVPQESRRAATIPKANGKSDVCALKTFVHMSSGF